MRATGMLLKVLSMLALTPGGGSNTKIRPARSRFTGTWRKYYINEILGNERIERKRSLELEVIIIKTNMLTCFISDVVYLGVDLHGKEEPEAGMRLHGMQLLLQLHQPSGGQVDVLQHHPPAGQKQSGYTHTHTYQNKVYTQEIHNAHLPDLTAVLISLSALLKPSAEPVDRGRVQMFNNNILTKL